MRHTRADLLALTKMDVESYKTLLRRKQTPYFDTSEDAEGGRNSFTAFEILLLILANDLVHRARMDRTFATEIVEKSAQRIWPRWNDIVLSSQDGAPKDSQVLCGPLWTAEKVTFFIGKPSELRDQRPFSFAMLTNVSEALCVLRVRAAKARIKLHDSFLLPTNMGG